MCVQVCEWVRTIRQQFVAFRGSLHKVGPHHLWCRARFRMRVSTVGFSRTQVSDCVVGINLYCVFFSPSPP